MSGMVFVTLLCFMFVLILVSSMVLGVVSMLCGVVCVC